MSHFGIAHLSVGKSDRKSARAQRRGGVFFAQCGYVGTAVHKHGVAFFDGVESVSVHDDQCIGCLHNCFTSVVHSSLLYNRFSDLASMRAAEGKIFSGKTLETDCRFAQPFGCVAHFDRTREKQNTPFAKCERGVGYSTGDVTLNPWEVSCSVCRNSRLRKSRALSKTRRRSVRRRFPTSP